MKKKFRNSLLAVLSLAAIGMVAVGCNGGNGGGSSSGSSSGGNVGGNGGSVVGGNGQKTEYIYNFDEPLRAECDSFMTMDGKLDEEAWKDQNYLYWVGGKNNEIKATTLFTSKGLYVGIRAEDYAVKHSGERYYFARNSRFRIQVVQEDEINYNNNRGNIHPTRQFWFDIDAANTLSRMERQYDAGSYVEGEVNGETEYMSAELFLPWDEMGYKEEELNEAGVPNAVKLLIQYWTPSTGYSGFPGFTDDDKFETYYTYDKDGSTCYVDRYSQTETVGYSVGGWTPGDKWEMNEDKTAATNTVNRTQILWFRKDKFGNADSGGTHYVASVKVKAKQVSGMYPHVGIMTLSSKTIFSIYGVATSGLKAGANNLSISAAQATDGGQWVDTKKFTHTFNRAAFGGVNDAITLDNGITVNPDELYLTVAKRGSELYYFVNGQYIGMEYDERVAGECVVGLFANGQTTISNWELEDYSNKPEDLDDYLRNYVHFLTAEDNGGGYAYLDRIVTKNGESFNVSITPKPGYILTELKFTENGEVSDKYDYFLENAVDANLEYTPASDLHIKATFKKLDNSLVKKILFKLTDVDDQNVKLVGATYTIRGLDANGNIDNRFVISGSANSQGNIVGSLLKATTEPIVIAGKEVSVTGNYELEIVCDGYITQIFPFKIAEMDENGEVFSLKGRPYGPVSVNGNTQASKGYMFQYEEGDREVGGAKVPNYIDDNGYRVFTDETLATAGIQYMRDSIYDGNFVFEGSISLLEDAKFAADDPENKWRAGAIVGYVFSTGAGYVEMKTTARAPSYLFVNYNGGTEMAFDNFPSKNNRLHKQGDEMQFKVARYNNVVYVYNCNGELCFTIDKFGIEAVNSKIVENASKLDAFNAGMKSMFAKGTQMAIGMYRMRSSEAGGTYQYKFTYTNNAEVVKSQFEAVTLGLKEGVSGYTLHIESKYKIEDAYLKEANVTTVFSGIAASEKNYVLAVEFANGTTRDVFGKYDKAKGTYTATFSLSDDAVVYLKEYDFGPITVNGETVSTMTGVMLTKNDDGTYGNKFNQTGGILQYFTNKTATGNYLATISIEVAEQVPTSGGGPGWAYGSGVGIMLTGGKDKSVNFFTNAWEGDRLLLGIGQTLVKITGFPRDNSLRAIGNQFNFKILRYDNVLYFYNCNDILVFHVDQTGIVVDLPTSTIIGTAVAQNLMRETLISMFNAGDQTGFGIYREYLPKSEGAYNWDVQVTNDDNVVDGFEADINLKDGETYSMEVIKSTIVNGSYMMGAPVTLQFSNVPVPTTYSTYKLVYTMNDETEYALGVYDKINNTFTATIPLTGSAEVWIEEYAFGTVTVNGKVETGNSVTLSATSDGAWAGPQTAGGFTQYYLDKVLSGDYVIDGTITTLDVNPDQDSWHTGGGFGIKITAGGDNWLNLFANAWEQGWFIQTKSSGANAIRVKGSVTMDAMMRQGQDMNFYVIRLNNVIYFYTAQGTLAFHIDANGLTVDNSGCTITHRGTDDVVYNQVIGDIQNFFAAGTENAIGVLQLAGAVGAYGQYAWDINTNEGTAYATQIKESFDNRITTLSSATVNGTTITGAEKVASTDPFTGEFVYSNPTGGLLGFIPDSTGATAAKATGNFIVDFTLEGGGGLCEFRIYTTPTSWIAFTAKDGANTAGENGIYIYADKNNDQNSSWWTETRMKHTDGSVFTNPNIRGVGAVKMRVVNFSNTFYFFSNTYWDSANNVVATADTYTLIALLNGSNFTGYNGMTISSNGGGTHIKKSISNFFAAATNNEFAFAMTGHSSPEFRANMALNDSDTEVNAFMNTIDVPGITFVNGAILSDVRGTYWTQGTDGVWSQSTADGSAYKVVEKASGDFMATLKINSASKEANVRFFYDATNFVELMSPNNKQLFFTGNGKWATETLIGASTNVFHNQDFDTVTGSDGYLDAMVVKSGNTFSVYVCEYLDGSGNAATHSNWKLMFSVTADGTTTYGEGFSQASSNGWGGVVTQIKGVLSSNEVAIALACRNGTGKSKVNVVDDDATVAAFVAGNKSVAIYAKA